jgi:hypothetical protein
MTLEMFGVQIGLGAVRAGKFAVCVFLRDLASLGRPVHAISRHRRATGC